MRDTHSIWDAKFQLYTVDLSADISFDIGHCTGMVHNDVYTQNQVHLSLTITELEYFICRCYRRIT